VAPYRIIIERTAAKLSSHEPTARPAGLYRPQLGSVTVSIIVGLYLLFCLNSSFWAKVHTYLGSMPGAVAALYVAMSALFIAALTIFSAKYVIKPFLILLIAVAATASWFTDRFGVIVDSDMVRNAFQTTPAEAGNLITPGFVWHLLLFAGLPIALLLWVKIRHRLILKKLMWNTAVIFGCLAVFGLAGFSYSKIFIGAIRQHRDIVKSLNPVTPLSGTIKYIMQASAEARVIAAPLGLDAKVSMAQNGVTKPRIAVIVAGETARAANFSLNGYTRDTNPELEKRDIIYFPNTTSCGTATATSVPCMFSKFTRSEYSHRKGLANETLLDVLAHAGIDVAWWDNNTGSKGVADRVSYVDLVATADPRFCEKGECKDAIFYDKIDAWLDQITKDSVVVVHQMGSHGPSYYRRYTDEFRRFEPDCQTAELGKCLDSQIVNSYDNTILYTDHFLATLIDKLAARSDKLATGMIYMSDHGESLGEDGLYLHGTPYAFAPDEQTHVPFLVWFDKDFGQSMGLDKACLAQIAASQPHSHDNLFHSVLGMMNVETSVYDPALDVFSACRKGRAS
jgi:lipid A ethanolaminephosphotransferase